MTHSFHPIIHDVLTQRQHNHLHGIFRFIWMWLVVFFLVQSPSWVQLFVAWPAARQASLSFTVTWSLLKFMSTESMMPSKHLILCHPLCHLPIYYNFTYSVEILTYFECSINGFRASLVAQLVKNAPAVQETQFDSWVGKIPWRRDSLPTSVFLDFPGGSDGKESAWNMGDLGSIPGLGRSPRKGHGNPLQYSGLKNPHRQRSLVGYSPWGHKRVRHD